MDEDRSATVRRETQPGWSERWSPLGGLLFAIGVIVMFVASPGDMGENASELAAYAADNEAYEVGVVMFMLVSLGLLGWFVSGLHARVRRMESQTAPALVLYGGAAFALLLFLATTVWNAPLIGFDEGVGSAETRAAVIFLLEDVGWAMLSGAGVGAALMAVSASLAALRSRVVPAWLGWIGVVVGALAALTFLWFGIFAWLLWILVASTLMLVRRT